MTRPAFLIVHTASNGEQIIAAFKTLPKDQAVEIDQWLLHRSCYGSLSYAEKYLWNWINVTDPLSD